MQWEGDPKKLTAFKPSAFDHHHKSKMLSFLNPISSRIEVLEQAASRSEDLGDHKEAAEKCIEAINTGLLEAPNLFRFGIRASKNFAREGLTDSVNKTIQEWVIPNEKYVGDTRVGTSLFSVAELLEKHGGNPLMVYSLASKRMEVEAPCRAVHCLRKMGVILASSDPIDLGQASVAFLKAGKIAVKGDLIIKFSAKNLFMNAILCLAASGISPLILSELHVINNTAVETDYLFKGSREAQFMTSLIKALNERSSDALNLSITEFTSIVPMERWQQDLLSKITSHLA